MNGVRTKICGITSLADALFVSDAGADALGFNFFEESPRFVDPSLVRLIVQQLPPFVKSVALFVNAERAYINQVLAETSVDLLQFHGDEEDSYCNSFNKAYIKALRVSSDLDLKSMIHKYKFASGVLLDASVQGTYGGTGKVFDWSLIPVDVDKPIILAGGLTVENVKCAIESIHPYGVDVSSGVEKTKGKKDKNKVKQFLKAAGEASSNE